MKKAGLVLIIVTLLFCAFAIGFFLGRSLNNTTISVSTLPTKAPAQETTGTDPTSTVPQITYPLNINTATAADFTTLPGIGETLAQNIVDYRAENGPFETLADLLLVEGIGDKKLSAILEYITIGGQS